MNDMTAIAKSEATSAQTTIGRPDIKAARGTMPVLQFCLPEQLRIDPLYQRTVDAPPSRALINRMTREWDWGLFQPLVVAQRPGGGLYVIDGQHRLEAARHRKDIAQLPCVVTMYVDPREEAIAFVKLNEERRPLTKLHIFHAALAAGEEDAVAIQQVLEQTGLRLTGAADKTRWKPGWINSVTAVQRCFRQHGEAVTRITLSALAEAFKGQILRHGTTLFEMIASLVARHHATISPALLVDLLRDRDGDEWMAAARERASADAIGVQAAARLLLSDAYEEAIAE